MSFVPAGRLVVIVIVIFGETKWSPPSRRRGSPCRALPHTHLQCCTFDGDAPGTPPVVN